MDRKFTSEICSRSFSRSSNLKIHKKTKHEHVSLNFSCHLWRKNFRDHDHYLSDIGNHEEGLSFVLYKSGFDHAIKVFREHCKNYFSLNDILNKAKNVHNLFDTPLLHYTNYKCSISLQVEYLLKRTVSTVLEKNLIFDRPVS